MARFAAGEDRTECVIGRMNGVNALTGTVAEIGYRGDRSICKVRLSDGSLMQRRAAKWGVQIAPLYGRTISCGFHGRRKPAWC